MDPGRGLNAEINYFIESPIGADAPFEIDVNTGEITVKNKVDREALGPRSFIQVCPAFNVFNQIKFLKALFYISQMM